MVLVVRNENNEVTNVYGYIAVRNIEKHVRDKYPDTKVKWELAVPSEYTGDIHYLPEDDV